MIDWPAVIQYEGDDELTYIASEEEWARDSATYLYNHTGNSFLIDSKGDIFSLGSNESDAATISNTGDRISLGGFIRLVRIHASTVNRCCIEKISFRTIADGVKLIDSMNEQE
jgi:hypothetical protein